MGFVRCFRPVPQGFLSGVMEESPLAGETNESLLPRVTSSTSTPTDSACVIALKSGWGLETVTEQRGCRLVSVADPTWGKKVTLRNDS